MTDFFISYTHSDERWAEWIAYVLEENGFSTIIQAWDFRPGSNFVLEMQKAASTAKRTIMVLSPRYLASNMTAPEWASAFARDPQGNERTLLPVMVEKCDPTGLLPTIVQIRIMDLAEDAAREKLLAGVSQLRAKPSNRPVFPGSGLQLQHKQFPGSETALSKTSVLPQMKRQLSDVERRRFLKQSIETIRKIFERNLETADQEEARVETDFTTVSATDFSAELFLDGKSKCRCRIWLANDLGSESIGYQEGSAIGNTFNEILYPSTDREAFLSATMDMGMYQSERTLDMKRLTTDDAAGYLWSRFTRPLSY